MISYFRQLQRNYLRSKCDLKEFSFQQQALKNRKATTCMALLINQYKHKFRKTLDFRQMFYEIHSSTFVPVPAINLLGR